MMRAAAAGSIGARAIAMGAFAAAVWAVACADGGTRSAETAEVGHAKVGGAVVSTVHGHAITVAEVEALARAGRLEPREALRRLQDERLLMAEAERRGLARDREVGRVGEQAMAQAVLEQTAAAVRVSESELREAYEAQKSERFSYAERRASLHVLAYVREASQEESARAFIARVHGELADAANPEAVWARYQTHVEEALDVRAERIPAVERDAPFAKPYLDALFSAPKPGVLPQPVRTRFGWHAIVLTEITPPADVPLAEAAEVLRPELVLEKRREASAALLARLRRGVTVRVEPDAVRRVAALEP